MAAPTAGAAARPGLQDGSAVQAAPTAEDSARAAELDALAAEIGSRFRCLVCRGQSVQESSAPLAREMQALIRQKLEEGETPEEIEAFFVASYGDFILLKPPAQGLNLVVYVAPAAAFVAAFVIVLVWLRRDRGSVPAAAVATDPRGPAPSDLEEGDRAWLDAAIRGDRE